MGYTHYWYRDEDLDREAFKKICIDFRKLNKVFPHVGFKLANGLGEDEPTITYFEISFNGLDKCGHPKNSNGLQWPDKKALGIATGYSRKQEETKTGQWFAGSEVNTRVCSGSCSYETFTLEQHQPLSEYDRNQGRTKSFECCKTNYYPYDLAVTACLIIAKHYLGDQIIIKSDGEQKDFNDAMIICQQFLGYGSDFDLNNQEAKKEVIKPSELKPELEQKQESRKEIKINDVFYTSWGYDQTNYDYIKVVSINKSGKSVKCVSIGAKHVSQAGFMAEKIKPDPENIISKPFNMFVENKNYKRCKYNDPEAENLRGTYIKHDQPFRLDTFWPHDGKEDLETSYH